MSEQEKEHAVPSPSEPSPKVKSSRKKWLLALGGVVLVLLLVLGGLYAWLSYGTVTQAKVKVFNAIPYPAVFVNGKPILAREIWHRLEIAKKSLPADSGVTDEEITQQVYDKIVSEEKANILANQKGLSVTDSEVNDQYSQAVEQLTGGDNAQFDEMLGQYGLNETEFKKQVLRPDLLLTKLVVWYNGQESLNAAAHDKVKDFQKQLSEGKTFQELAAQSQDPESASMEGDLGFVEVNKLLPEFKDALTGSGAGETKVVSSRYGVHLFKIEEVDGSNQEAGPRMHIRQIFVEAAGFEDWYENETKNYTVKKFINI